MKMTKKILKKQQGAHQCAACGMDYRDEAYASKCKRWCAKHKSCNLEIVKHALMTSGGKK